MSPSEDADALKAAAESLGLVLSSSQRQSLLGYLALLAKWNRVYNLTAVRDRGQVLRRHLLDCLAVVPPLHRRFSHGGFRLLDVGSGGGLPGVPIAILSPEAAVTCVDASAKKAAFIRQAGAELGIGNLDARHVRVERLRERFDVIASRAFASLPDLVDLTRPLLDEQGVWMVMKGRSPVDELSTLPDDIEFHVEQLRVPFLDAWRCLVWMRPAS